MRRYLIWILLCLGAGLSGCATTPRCPSAASPSSPPFQIDTTKACASWRWIGIKKNPDTDCPEVPGWEVSSLFEPRERNEESEYSEYYDRVESDPPDPVSDSEEFQELKRFCVYEVRGWHKKLGKVQFPPAADPDLVRFDQDCAILSPSGSTVLDGKSQGLLFEHFLKEVGRSGVSPKFDGKADVRLAFLDTHPTSEPGEDVLHVKAPPRSWHGYTLAQIAKDLICAPQGSCAAQITTQLALPIVRFHSGKKKHYKEDLDRGGFIGMQGQLAQAITEEVNAWLQERRDNPERAPRHLVLNLSVAWDERLFGGLDEEWMSDVRAGTQAVYRALQYAAANDVLVLAAAGNKRTVCPRADLPGFCPSDGMLLPAAWENGHPADQACDASRRAPLLYAVGGLQSGGAPLANARPGGMPRRAAYGEYAVVSSSHPEQPTKIYMGSSIATAVASSIAAVVWDAFPDFTSQEIAELLYSSGEALESSNSALGAKAPSGAHKLSFCRAVREACHQRPSQPCPIESDCPSWMPAELTPPVIFPMETSPANSCQPWLFPQPGDYPCLGCPPDYKG